MEQEGKYFKKEGAGIIVAAVVLVLVVGGLVYFTQYRAVTPIPGVDQLENFQGTIKTYEIAGKPFEFSMKEIRVKKGDGVRIKFTSTEGMHDIVVDEFNARTKQLTAGQQDTMGFVADKTGTFEYYCSVGNHRQMGMVGKLIVE